MLLSVQNFEVCYGVISALQGVSIDIDRGEIVTLIGGNGAGKTTLLRTISGLLRPKQGRAVLDGGHDLTKLPAHEIVRLGVSHAPEGRQIFANLSVRENLMLGAYQRSGAAEIQADLDRCYTLFPVLAERREQRSGTL